MDASLIPVLEDWVIEELQANGSSFLMCVYNEKGKKLVGCILAERINTIRFDKTPHLSFRLLRYIIDDEPHICCLCKSDNKYEGWLWQQKIEFFICAGCSMKN